MNECNELKGCPMPEVAGGDVSEQPNQALHQVIFVTDTICSHCWAIEPAWRRLLLEYDVTVRYIHGGLLPGWKDFADSGNAISKPTDVIPHWKHVARVSGQPIDPSVWADDPLSNSYVLCRAAIAVRLLKPEAEAPFVRRMRELVFMDAVNITKKSVLADCARAVGIEQDVFAEILDCRQVEEIFAAEQQQMRLLGARGFPSLIFLGDNPSVVVGSRPFAQLENALLGNSTTQVQKRQLNDEQKLTAYSTWTLTEACEVLQKDPKSARSLLEQLGYVEQKMSAGTLWQTR